MKILMFTWEFPPLIAGGLGMACYGMVKAMLAQGIKVDLVLPTKEMVYFPLREEGDVDSLPVVFMDPVLQNDFSSRTFSDPVERLKYIGVSTHPESYHTIGDIKSFVTRVEEEYLSDDDTNKEEYNLWQQITTNLDGDNDFILKVQEFTQRAERFAKELEYDLIHAHDWLTYPSGMLARKLSGKPLVVHIHATEFDRAGGPGNPQVHGIEHAGMTYADRVIAVSKYTAQMIVSRYKIDTAKVRIVHNAFTLEENRVFTRERLFKGPTILFLGRLTLQKGPDYYLDVAKLVLEKHPQATFIMAGTGDMGRHLLRRSAKMGLKNRFLFAGFLNRQQVEIILQASDIYMLPSVSEPFGISPLEAMAFGVTSIISKQSGVSEVVHNAYKVDYWDVDLMAETINDLIENPDKRITMGYRGMKEVNQIHWTEAADKIHKVYNEVLAQFSKSQD